LNTMFPKEFLCLMAVAAACSSVNYHVAHRNTPLIVF
jgi:hypothetical protein